MRPSSPGPDPAARVMVVRVVVVRVDELGRGRAQERALAARRLLHAGAGAGGFEHERALLGLGPHDEGPRVVPEIDWARLLHKSGGKSGEWVAAV